MITTLRMADIRTDGGTQMREEINYTRVIEYAEEMANGDVFPPLGVTYDGANYWLHGGFHRLEAYKRLGLAYVEADVQPGTLADARWRAYAENKAHGERRSNEAKQSAVKGALRDWPNLYGLRPINFHEVARHVGVGVSMVSEWAYKLGYCERSNNCTNSTIAPSVTSEAEVDTEQEQIEFVEAPEAPTEWPVVPESEQEQDDEEELPSGCHDCAFLQTHGEDWWCTKLQRPTSIEYIVCDMRDWQSEDDAPEPEPEPEPEAPASVPHVAYNSGNNEWYTPEPYITAARAVMGGIDLDPASSGVANATVQANTYYTIETDGLCQPWRGRVWMNPPYAGDLVGKFTAKLANHVTDGDVTEAIVLVNNATETGWFANLVSVASAICFPRGRIRYWTPEGVENSPLQGQAFVYIGEQVDRFRECFAGIGWSAVL